MYPNRYTVVLQYVVIHPGLYLMKDALNETAEGPTFWSLTLLNGLNGVQDVGRIESTSKGIEGTLTVDEDFSEAPSPKLALSNSTFNNTTSEEVRGTSSTQTPQPNTGSTQNHNQTVAVKLTFKSEL